MDLGRVSFLKRVYLAITDFRLYPFTLKEKLGRAILYFIKLLILASIVMAIFVTSNFFKLSEETLNIYKEVMPEFSVQNGVLQVEEPIEQEINDTNYLIVNSEYDYSRINDIVIEEEKEHDYYILVLADATTIGVRENDGIMELITIPYEDISFTKSELATEWNLFNNDFLSRIMVWLMISLGILIVLAIIRVWSLLMYVMSAVIINFIFGIRLKFSDYLKVAIYASTLPMILEIVAILVVGGISQTISFISMLVSVVYIFYALRAVKIDAIILGGTGKAAEERMKSALLHAKEELTKQLEELEKKEETLQRNGDNSDELEQIKELEEINKELIEKEENLYKAKMEYEETVKKVIEFGTQKSQNETPSKNESEKSEEEKDKTETEKNEEEKDKNESEKNEDTKNENGIEKK